MKEKALHKAVLGIAYTMYGFGKAGSSKTWKLLGWFRDVTKFVQREVLCVPKSTRKNTLSLVI